LNENEHGFFGNTSQLKDILKSYHLVEAATITEYRENSTVSKDLALVRCYTISVQDESTTLLYAEPGSTLKDTIGGTDNTLVNFFNKYHVMDETLKVQYSMSQKVTQDMVLIVSLKITLSGETKGTIYIKRGARLDSNSVLKSYFAQPKLYSVRNKESTSSNYKPESIIHSDTEIEIVPICEAFTKESDCEKTALCEWVSKRSVCKRNDGSSDEIDDAAWIIPVTIILVVAVIGIVVAIVVPLLLKKQKEKEKNQ